MNGFQSEDVTKLQIGMVWKQHSCNFWVVADATRVHQCSSLDIGVIHLDVMVDMRDHNRRVHVKCPLKMSQEKESDSDVLRFVVVDGNHETGYHSLSYT